MNAPGAALGSARRWARWLFLATLYLAGAAHWTWFFGTAAEPFRGPSFTREDWPKEYRYYSILQQAVREGEMPYLISRPIHTRRFRRTSSSTARTSRSSQAFPGPRRCGTAS